MAQKLLYGKTDKNGKKFAVGYCGRYLSPDKNMVEVWRSPTAKNAKFRNLEHCHSTWACPWCSYYIASRRCREVETAVRCHIEDGGSILFATLTMSHKAYHSLRQSFEVVSDAKSGMISDRRYKGPNGWAARYGVIGSITSMETTYGRGNGYHVHLHVMYFLSGACVDVDAARHDLFTLWEREVTKRGRYVDEQYAVKLDPPRSEEDVASYISQIGGYERTEVPESMRQKRVARELTLSHIKTARKFGGKFDHYTMFEILANVAAGVNDDLADVFVEYAIESKGRHQLEWSEGLKDRFGIDQVKDGAIVEDVSGHTLWAEIFEDDWALVVKGNARGLVDQLAITGDKAGLDRLLDKLRKEEAFGVGDERVHDDERDRARLDRAKWRNERLRAFQLADMRGVAVDPKYLSDIPPKPVSSLDTLPF